MSVPERRPQTDPALERLLREALPDDLPPEVEARLQTRLRAFLFVQRAAREQAAARPTFGDPGFSARGRWTVSRIALVAAAALVSVSGLSLQAAVAPGVADDALRRIGVSVSVFRSLRNVSSLPCVGMTDASLASPGSLAEHVYRLWVPIGARQEPSGALVGAYHTADRAFVYELVLDGTTTLPREIVRRDARAGVARATCDWTRTTPQAGGEPR